MTRLTKAQFAGTYKKLFWEHRHVDLELLKKELGVTQAQVDSVMQTTNVMETLAAFHIPTEQPKGLSPRQVVWVNALASVNDNRTLRAKAKEFGITVQLHEAWMRNPKFVQFYRNRLYDTVKENNPAVHLAVTKNALSGDVSAQKLYLELQGDYRPNDHRVNVKVDFTQTVDQLIEIIQQECTPEQTLRIAQRFGELMSAQEQINPLAPVGTVIDVCEAPLTPPVKNTLHPSEETLISAAHMIIGEKEEKVPLSPPVGQSLVRELNW